MALVEFTGYGLGERASSIGTKVIFTDEAHATGTTTSDTLEWGDNPEGLAFIFTTNTGAGATTTWILQGSQDNSSWIAIDTGTLTGNVTLTTADVVQGMTTAGALQVSIPWHYYRFSLTTAGATHTFGITAFFKGY